MSAETGGTWQCPKCGANNSSETSVCSSCMSSVVEAGLDAIVRERLDRAKAFEAEGRLDQAIVQLLEASKAKPGDWEAHWRLGLLYEKKERLIEAAVSFESAVRARPDHADSHYRLGTIYRAQDRLEEALAQFSLALQLEPEHAGARSQAAELGSVRRDAALKPAEQPKREKEIIEIKPRPLLSAQNAWAAAAAVGVGLAASAAAGFMFLVLTSPQLVERQPPFTEFMVSAMLVAWLLSGVACASVTAPLLPVAGAFAGIVSGAVGPLLAAHITRIPLEGSFVGRAAVAGMVLTCGAEFLTRGTFLGERRRFLFWGTVAALVIFTLARVGSQGMLRGHVKRHVLAGGEDYAEVVPNVDVLLISSTGETYHSVSSDSNHGGYFFRGMPAGAYFVQYRDPVTGHWQRTKVKAEYALTAGARLDLWVSGRRR